MRTAVLVAVLLASACHEPSAPATTTSPPAQVEADPYAAYDFPSLTGDWGPSDYAKVRDLFVAIERTQPELLVTLTGPRGDVLARFASLDAITRIIAEQPDIEATFAVTEALGQTAKLYAARADDQRHYGSEYVLLSAATLRAATQQFARMTEELGEAAFRADPIRREGLAQMRHGLVLTYLNALQSPLEQPELDAALAQLGAVATDIGPFLLPSERERLDAVLDALEAAGAKAAAIASIRASVAASPMHTLAARGETPHDSEHALGARSLCPETL